MTALILKLLGKYKWYACGIVGTVILVLAGYVYFQWSQKRIDTLEQNVIQLENVIAQQKAVIIRLEKDINDIKAANESLRQIENKVTAKLESLQEKFNKDWNHITYAKPALVQNIIDNASNERNRCFTILTGGKLTEEEANGKVKNSLCQDYISSAHPAN